MNDWLKVAFLVPLHLILAPIAGLLMRRHRTFQRIVFFLMIVLTMASYRIISMSPWYPEPFYHGHTRGYECTILEVLAIALIFANVRVAPAIRGPWIPPGLLLWLVYCGVSLLSIFNSVNPSYTMMAFVKFTKVAVVYVAAFQFIRDERDIHLFLAAAAVALLLQLGVCLKQRYIDHIHQVHAWFEHQNSMVMYSYMLGLPLLAAALTTRRRKQMALYLAGFCAAAFTTILSLSRGGLGAMAAGILIVVCLILWDQVTLRRLVIIGTLGVLSLIPIGKSAGTIIERFTDPATHVSNEAREILNATSREMVRDYPVFGTGWNTYTVMIHPPYKYSNLLYDWELARGMRSDSHDVVERGASESWYYLLLAETGLVGTTAMFAFILITLFWCARSVYFYRRTVIGAVAIGLLAGIGMNYLQSNLERVLTQPKNLVAWMICLGIIARLEWWRRNPSLGPIQAQPALQPTEPVD